jgi:hypothetical protein
MVQVLQHVLDKRYKHVQSVVLVSGQVVTEFGPCICRPAVRGLLRRHAKLFCNTEVTACLNDRLTVCIAVTQL